MRSTNAKLTFSFSLLACLLLACEGDPSSLTGRGHGSGGPDDGTAQGQDPGAAAQDPAQCAANTQPYAGFDSRDLTAGRPVVTLGTDRARMKPFSALQGEYARALGGAPASLAGAAATFGNPPQRWYEEPLANAVALETAYDIAFDGCLTYTQSAPEFASAPDANSAATQCAAMARKFWSKTPGPQEIQPCVDVATTGATSEPDPRRKWAYACASVLTSAGFLTY